MAHRQPALHQRLLDDKRGAGQTQQIGNMTAALANGLGQLCLRISKFIDKPLISFGFFHRIEVSALDIFDQPNLQSGDIIDRLHNHRHLMQSRLLRCPPTSFTGNDFKTVTCRAHQQGLQHARFFNRGGERVQLFLGKIFARLKRTGAELVNADITQAALFFRRRRFSPFDRRHHRHRGRRGIANQSRQAAPQTAPRLAPRITHWGFLAARLLCLWFIIAHMISR